MTHTCDTFSAPNSRPSSGSHSAPGIRAARIAMMLLFLIVLAGPVEVTASESVTDSQPQVLFNRGNYMMEEQNYAGALEHFHQIMDMEYESGALYYNLGLSYVYLDSLGKAAYFFHKSSEFRDAGEQAKRGIAFIESQLQNRGTYIPYLPWYAITDWFWFGLHHEMWVIRGLVFLNFGVILVLTGWFFYPNRWIALGGLGAVAIGLFLVIAAGSVYLWSERYNQAVIVEEHVSIHPDPETDLDPENVPDLAYEGYTVTLDQRTSRDHPGWMHIRLRNGISGWVPEESLKIF